MRKSKGKWVASYKDIWDLDNTLSPIILAGLVRFKEQLVKSEFSGVPSSFVKGDEVTDEDIASWHKTVDSMIYAFDSKNLPSIQDYDFKIDMEYGNTWNDGSREVFLKCNNDKEKERYYKALEEHHKKCEEGRMLFAKYYENLWY